MKDNSRVTVTELPELLMEHLEGRDYHPLQWVEDLGRFAVNVGDISAGSTYP